MKNIAPQVVAFILIVSSSTMGQVMSPAAYLGYEPGERFTRLHDLHGYFRHVADESDKVAIHVYGETWQKRPLKAVIISSEANIRERETIRHNNRIMAGLEKGERQGPAKAILWMSYGIHGNEASGPEAAMLTLYELVSGNQGVFGHTPNQIDRWLEHTIIIMDPVLNPDGRERYVSWFEQTTGRNPDPRMETREHYEPWPGGRGNHYYVDLNRDWIWQIQPESRYRSAFYYEWMPHVHADFHEMTRNDYFFPPSAQPMHDLVTDWQKEFQAISGKNHAAYFDHYRQGYFSNEIFDLFYPGYGDSWPSFNGAIGMTYEQMGHGRAGLSVLRQNGDTLTLRQRLMNQHMVGMSTVETTADNHMRLKEEFKTYFDSGRLESETGVVSYVISGNNTPDKLKALKAYLNRQEITYAYVDEGRRMNGVSYLTGEKVVRRTVKNDLVISLHQPKAVLASILFDPSPKLPLPESYDITAWALPYAFGLEAWVVNDNVRVVEGKTEIKLETTTNLEAIDRYYAFALPWNDIRDAGFLAALLKKGVTVHHTERPFQSGEKTFSAGSLVILKGRNQNLETAIEDMVANLAKQYGRNVVGLSSGHTDTGPDLSSPAIHYLKAPNVALLSGSAFRSANVGEIWHYFDQRLHYPLALFDWEQWDRFPLEDYEVLILPEGNYNRVKDRNFDRILDWVRDGGRIIAFSDAVNALSKREELGIEVRSSDRDTVLYDRRFENRRIDSREDRLTGAIYRVNLDDSHPLAFGMGTTYASVRRGGLAVDPLKKGWNVGLIPNENARLAGWSGERVHDRQLGSLAAGLIQVGRGQIILITDNPLFRGYWRNGELLMSNAIFQAGIAR